MKKVFGRKCYTVLTYFVQDSNVFIDFSSCRYTAGIIGGLSTGKKEGKNGLYEEKIIDLNEFNVMKFNYCLSCVFFSCCLCTK